MDELRKISFVEDAQPSDKGIIVEIDWLHEEIDDMNSDEVRKLLLEKTDYEQASVYPIENVVAPKCFLLE